jgi:hypothetical protein
MCVLLWTCAGGVLCADGKKSPPATEPAEKAARKASAGTPKVGGASADEVVGAIEQLKGLVEQQSRELEAQRAALQAQQEKIQALERQIARQAAGTTPAPPEASQTASQEQQPQQAQQAQAADLKLLGAQLEAVADSQNELAGRVGKMQAEAAARNSSIDSKLRQLGNFSFSGDLRLRYEPFYGGGDVSSPPPESRHRPRFRLRFNVDAKFSDEISGGFTLASGDAPDNISTNQTFTNFFQRKFVGIDRAFVRYNPGYAKPLTLVAGKFAYTWYRTELTLDNDMNPEGFSQILSFDLRNSPLRQVVLVGFQLPFNEVSNGPDSFLNGGQFQTHWKLGNRVRFATYVGFYDWLNADAFRAAQTAGRVTGNTSASAATPTQFASKFGILDVIGRADLTTWSTRWPLMLQVDFASNTRACTNLKNITTTPLPACDPSQRSAWYAEARLGQTREVRDFALGYTFFHIEREAVLGGFNFSDIRQANNVLSHRVTFDYQAWRNVTLSYTGLFGRALVTPLTPTEERFLKRSQFDFLYRF